MTNRSARIGHAASAGIAIVLLSGCSSLGSARPVGPDRTVGPDRPVGRTVGGAQSTPVAGGSALQGRVVSRTTGAAIDDGHRIVVSMRPAGDASLAAAAAATAAPVHLRRTKGGLVPAFVVVVVGQPVRFDNEDGLCHSFFATSAKHRFDTKLLRPGATKEIRFDHPGTVHVYCSLHKGPQATILVVPSPHFAVVRGNGEFRIDGIAPGRYVVETRDPDRVLQSGRVDVSPGIGGFVRIAVPEPGAPVR